MRYRQGTGTGEAAFLDDGRTIIVGCENQGARLIDVTTGRTVGTIDFREFQVRHVTVSGDGARLAFAGTQYVPGLDLSVRHLAFWDRAAGGVLSRVQWNSNEGGELRAACFAPEGNVAALGLSDGSVRLIDVESGLTLKSRQLFAGDDFYNVAGVSFSRNGERLAALGEQGGFVWDWLEDGVPRSLPGYVGRARSAAFSPDGQRLAVAIEAHGSGSVCVRTYDAQSLEPVREIRNEREQHFSGVLAYTHDGARIALGVRQPNAIELHDAETGTLVQRFPLAIHSPRAIFMSPDDHWIGCTTGYPALRVWDLRTGQPAASTFEGHDDVPSSVEFTPDGQSVVTAGNDPFAMVWDAATGKLQHRLTHGLGKWVRGMALSADGQAIATSSLDDTVRIWDQRTGKLKYTLFGHGDVGGTRAVRFTPDGSRLLSWGDDLFLRIFDARTGKALQEHSLRPAGMTVQLDEDGAVDQGPAAPFFHFDGAAFTRDGTRLVLSMRST